MHYIPKVKIPTHVHVPNNNLDKVSDIVN